MKHSIIFFSLLSPFFTFGMDQGLQVKNKSSKIVTVVYQPELGQLYNRSSGMFLKREYISPGATLLLPSTQQNFFSVKVAGFSDRNIFPDKTGNPIIMTDKIIKHNNRKVSSVKISQSKINLNTLCVDEGEFV